MKKLGLAIPVLAIALAGNTACATKKFVRGEVGQVNEKVDGLGRSLEENQERTRTNETRIEEVDQRAQSAASAANKRAEEAHVGFRSAAVPPIHGHGQSLARRLGRRSGAR